MAGLMSAGLPLPPGAVESFIAETNREDIEFFRCSQ
jgi:hypothetical protein